VTSVIAGSGFASCSARAIAVAATIFVVLLILVMPSRAAAFCRTTTCEPDLESCERDDRGCVTSGVPLRWTKLPIVYRVSARGSTAFDRDEARTKIAAAFDAWTHAVCADGRKTSLTVIESDPVPDDKPLGQKRGPEPFGIYFRDGSWPYASATTTLAITNQEYGKESGRIIYSDIEVNTSKTPLTILELVVLHEAGHYLGLAHSQVDGSIMAAAYNNTGSRAPSADDLAGICELFPPDGLPAEEDEGCAVASAAEVKPPWFPFLVLAVFPMVLRRFRGHAAVPRGTPQPRTRQR
jgi:hypothetical protein